VTHAGRTVEGFGPENGPNASRAAVVGGLEKESFRRGLRCSHARVAQLVEAAGLSPVVRKHVGGSNPSPGTATVNAERELWDSVRHLFERDDSSLPEVVQTGLPADAIQPLFAFLSQRGRLRSRAQQLAMGPGTGGRYPCDDVPDAGEWVASGKIASFHVVFHGIRVGDIGLPPLGAFFVEDELAVDYRMGDDWTPDVLGAFVQLVNQMRACSGCPSRGTPRRWWPGTQRYRARKR
jgi:hypothetical protein